MAKASVLSPRQLSCQTSRNAFFSTVEKLNVRDFRRSQSGGLSSCDGCGIEAETREDMPFMLAKSSTELVRQQNSALVLSVLRREGRLSHTQISEATGLSSATVSAITADLERYAIIEKSEQQAASGRGRPRVLFSQRRDCGYLITVIISSDIIQYSLVDYAGTLLDRFAEARRESSPDCIGLLSYRKVPARAQWRRSRSRR